MPSHLDPVDAPSGLFELTIRVDYLLHIVSVDARSVKCELTMSLDSPS